MDAESMYVRTYAYMYVIWCLSLSFPPLFLCSHPAPPPSLLFSSSKAPQNTHFGFVGDEAWGVLCARNFCSAVLRSHLRLKATCWICAALPRGLLPYTQRLGIQSGLVLWTVAPLRRRAKQLHGGLIRFWKSFSS